MRPQDDRGKLNGRIREVYSSQQHLLAAFPRMIAHASGATGDLLRRQFELLRTQRTRLEQAAGSLSVNLKCTDGGIMQTILKEGLPEGHARSEETDVDVLSLAELAWGLHVRTTERARAFAIHLGLHDVAAILESMLEEEYRAEEVLAKALEHATPGNHESLNLALVRSCAKHMTRRRISPH